MHWWRHPWADEVIEKLLRDFRYGVILTPSLRSQPTSALPSMADLRTWRSTHVWMAPACKSFVA